MNNVKIADLKNNLSRHLGRVRHGGEITVIDRDTPIARIVPFRHADGAPATDRNRKASAERVAELARQGVLSPGRPDAVSVWLARHEPVRLPKGSPGAVKALLDMRRESTR